jgi:uncharacterized protein YtpQ (UPF0354 family)
MRDRFDEPKISRQFLRLLIVVLLFVAGVERGVAQSPPDYDDSAANLMVVLRESPGANKQDETLVRAGTGTVSLPDGKEVEIDFAWYEYLGDMHIRFVFDTPDSLPHATPRDLERLGLTPEAALDLAVRNIRRVYGEPYAVSWGDVMEVRGQAPDFFSSYFLDKTYWDGLLERYPEGIVAAVVKRGGLLYSPLSNERGVDFLRENVVPFYVGSERLRISSALYLYKDGRWTVFQPPVNVSSP